MNSIIKEKGITFKELEQNIFNSACEWARNATKELLEAYDEYLAKGRDKKAYRHKGKRNTTVKTVYGEVSYRRAIYETIDDNGCKKYVYLLDEALDLTQVGLISTNLAEQLVSGIVEMSYRECAEKASSMTGQRISAMGVWNVIQALGSEVCKEEEELVKAHKNKQLQGNKESPVLFEEADGVYLRLQGRDRQSSQKGKAEMKDGLAYDGWKRIGKERYPLNGKVAVAGFSKAKDFQEYREAAIAEIYNLDETEVRVLNGDGASWIKKVKDKSTCFQLDPFHKYKAIKDKVTDKRAAKEIRELLDEGNLEELFRYLELYRNSLFDDAEIEKINDLIRYFGNNRDGLLPYQKQAIELPASPEGLEYRNMGTMENHIWSIIAKRMKNNHTSWSRRGGNHLAKILAKKCSGRLQEVTQRLTRANFEKEIIEELQQEILTAGRAPKTDGKGYEYARCGHLISLENPLRGNRHTRLSLAGY